MTKIIEVRKPFLLNLQDGRKIHFTVGQHEVAHCIAEHWWTLEHASVVEVEAENAEPISERVADEPVAAAPAKSKKRSKGKPQEAPQQEVQ
jgi:hypothetical protein